MNPCESLGIALCERNFLLAVAESCTGGLMGATLTSTPGASAWFAGGVIAYANSAKSNLLGVDTHTLNKYGAVSQAVVKLMAAGACHALGADVGVSISGIAGPDGGNAEKPVGTVWIGYCVCGLVDAAPHYFTGTRENVRAEAVAAAVLGVCQRVAGISKT